MRRTPVVPALPRGFLVRALSGGVVRGGQAVAGAGRWAAAYSPAQAACQGQPWGRCRVRRRAPRAFRAGTLIGCARIVEVVARAWNMLARLPAARVRLCEIAHSTAHAALALKGHDGRCANALAAASAISDRPSYYAHSTAIGGMPSRVRLAPVSTAVAYKRDVASKRHVAA